MSSVKFSISFEKSEKKPLRELPGNVEISSLATFTLKNGNTFSFTFPKATFSDHTNKDLLEVLFFINNLKVKRDHIKEFMDCPNMEMNIVTPLVDITRDKSGNVIFNHGVVTVKYSKELMESIIKALDKCIEKVISLREQCAFHELNRNTRITTFTSSFYMSQLSSKKFKTEFEKKFAKKDYEIRQLKARVKELEGQVETYKQKVTESYYRGILKASEVMLDYPDPYSRSYFNRFFRS